jgi:nucleoside-diphosphate-sugar epimerase
MTRLEDRLSDSVLVTGAFGLVGTATVNALIEAGHHVVATDVDTPANRQAARAIRTSRFTVRWADLTDDESTRALVDEVSPKVIIHLAAIIPPFCYRNRALARRVNVDATATLIQAAESLHLPPRVVLASSIAVYGVRNPHRFDGVLTSDTAVNPCDNYGGHKVEAENLLSGSTLDWTVLRLGGVIPAEPDLNIDKESLYFESILPTDGRMHTVDVRDVGFAFAAAVSAEISHETLLIAGDETHRQYHGDLTPAFTAAIGLQGILPTKLPGDPDDDAAWFHTEWMDCTRAQALLSYQHHSWPEMMAELRERVGWKRPLFRMAAPLARRYLSRNDLASMAPGSYAQPWHMIRARWGDYAPDTEETN